MMFKNSKAFTLIELMVVIVIIGILATLAIPKFNEASVKAKVSEAPTVLSSYDNTQLAYLAETNALGDVTNLAMQNPTTIVSKYYTYSQGASGYLKGNAAASGMGKANSATIYTSINSAGTVTHSLTGSLGTYLPNWVGTN